MIRFMNGYSNVGGFEYIYKSGHIMGFGVIFDHVCDTLTRWWCGYFQPKGGVLIACG